MSQNLSSAAVVIGALRVKKMKQGHDKYMHNQPRLRDINPMWVVFAYTPCDFRALWFLHANSKDYGQTRLMLIRSKTSFGMQVI